MFNLRSSIGGFAGEATITSAPSLKRALVKLLVTTLLLPHER
jgi:hypothetical protein